MATLYSEKQLKEKARLLAVNKFSLQTLDRLFSLELTRYYFLSFAIASAPVTLT
jgi:hypothetical protein